MDHTNEILRGQANKLRSKAREKRRQAESKIREAEKLERQADEIMGMFHKGERLEEINDD